VSRSRWSSDPNRLRPGGQPSSRFSRREFPRGRRCGPLPDHRTSSSEILQRSSLCLAGQASRVSRAHNPGSNHAPRPHPARARYRGAVLQAYSYGYTSQRAARPRATTYTIRRPRNDRHFESL
jgi:hypothetical protein